MSKENGIELKREDINLMVSYSAFVLSGAVAGALGADGLGMIGVALLSGALAHLTVYGVHNHLEKSKQN